MCLEACCTINVLPSRFASRPKPLKELKPDRRIPSVGDCGVSPVKTEVLPCQKEVIDGVQWRVSDSTADLD